MAGKGGILTSPSLSKEELFFWSNLHLKFMQAIIKIMLHVQLDS